MITDIINLLEDFDYDKNTMEDAKELAQFIIYKLKVYEIYQDKIIKDMINRIEKTKD